MDVKIKNKIITISVIFTLFAYGLIIFIMDGGIIEVIGVGIVTSIVVGFWLLIDIYMWKFPVIRGFLHAKPNISGKWVGTIGNDADDGPHRAELLIKQTWTTIDIVTKSDRADSISLSAKIFPTSDSEAFYKLIFTWEAKAKKADGFGGKGGLMGTSILSIDEENKKMYGTYFTDMEPQQTKGNINFSKLN